MHLTPLQMLSSLLKSLTSPSPSVPSPPIVRPASAARCPPPPSPPRRCPPRPLRSAKRPRRRWPGGGGCGLGLKTWTFFGSQLKSVDFLDKTVYIFINFGFVSLGAYSKRPLIIWWDQVDKLRAFTRLFGHMSPLTRQEEHCKAIPQTKQKPSKTYTITPALSTCAVCVPLPPTFQSHPNTSEIHPPSFTASQTGAALSGSAGIPKEDAPPGLTPRSVPRTSTARGTDVGTSRSMPSSGRCCHMSRLVDPNKTGLPVYPNKSTWDFMRHHAESGLQHPTGSPNSTKSSQLQATMARDLESKVGQGLCWPGWKWNCFDLHGSFWVYQHGMANAFGISLRRNLLSFISERGGEGSAACNWKLLPSW